MPGATRRGWSVGIVKPPMVKLGLILCVLGVVAFGLLWARSSSSRRSEVDWLRVSRPLFGHRINAEGALTTVVSFTVSNASPHMLNFAMAWYELRDRTDHKVLASSVRPKPGGYVYGQFGPGNMIPLAPGAVVTQTIDSQQSSSALMDPLFCAEIGWIECNSLRRRIGVALDEKFKDVANILDRGWEPRFWREDTVGNVFTSNLRVQDYFSAVYGVATLKDVAHVSGTNMTSMAAGLAWNAFRGCRPNPEGGGRQPFGSGTNSTSAAAASRRSP